MMVKKKAKAKTVVSKAKAKTASVKPAVSVLTGPKVLVYDIETAPILGYVWSLWDQNVSLNQIHSDWYVLGWSAKWLHDPADKIMYMDQRNAKNIEDDSAILAKIWDLLDEADIVITQNGKHFDQRKLNARFLMNGFQPPSSYKHIDTKIIASRHFGFTSNKLEYMTDKLNTQYKKLKHTKFPGFEMWKECLAGNLEAWKEMEVYNKHDVLALEELYNRLIPWDNSINFNVYHDEETHVCKCGSESFIKNGFYYTSAGKYQKHKCKDCGCEMRDKVNLFTKEKRASLTMCPPRT
jgi:RNase_H superfamily